MRSYRVDEIREYLEQGNAAGKPGEYRQRGLRCPAAVGRGMGGFSKTALLIPESIHIVVSPPACGRHGDFDILAAGLKGRFYRVRLSEKDIVSGRGPDTLYHQLDQFLEEAECPPRVITICTTCVDGISHTDYSYVGRKIEEKYGIRFGVIPMFPFLADSPKNHQDMLMEGVYGLMRPVPGEKKDRAVNLIGRVTEADRNTDFPKLLEKAGYEVRELHWCHTLEEYDRMGNACLNVVLSPKCMGAARMMERKYKIPYIEFFETFSPDQILKNYRKLEQALGLSLDVEQEYTNSKARAEELRKALQGHSVAVGESVDYNPVKFACEWCEEELPLSYCLVDKISPEDREFYRKLGELKPDLRVYLATDSQMMTFMDHPAHVDYTVGIESILFLKDSLVRKLRMREEPCDFRSFSHSVDELLQGIDRAGIAGQKEKTVFSRNWSIYTEEEHE